MDTFLQILLWVFLGYFGIGTLFFIVIFGITILSTRGDTSDAGLAGCGLAVISFFAWWWTIGLIWETHRDAKRAKVRLAQNRRE